jgi:sporadic carbohydrate cluster protein (TIGR04323 family)
MKRMRGYISSRPFLEYRAPQHIQNIVIKDYCAARDIEFLLSATEHTMASCYMILEQIFHEVKGIDGVVFYSLFQFPIEKQKRNQFYQRMLESGKEFHFAMERIQAMNKDEFERLEDLWLLKQSVERSSDLLCRSENI